MTTVKELAAKLAQEKFDVKGFEVVFQDGRGDETGIASIELDAERQRLVLVSDGMTAVIEPDEER